MNQNQLNRRMFYFAKCACVVCVFVIGGCSLKSATTNANAVADVVVAQNQQPSTAPEKQSGNQGANDVQPNPALTPEQVVRVQLQALKMNDTPTPDNGIAVAFRFASPGNKEVTGPLPRFIELVKNPVYRPLINHRSASQFPVDIEGNEATQRVRVIDENGAVAVFLFTLTKQTKAPFKDCWMIDGVERLAPGKDDRSTIARVSQTNGNHS